MSVFTDLCRPVYMCMSVCVTRKSYTYMSKSSLCGYVNI